MALRPSHLWLAALVLLVAAVVVMVLAPDPEEDTDPFRMTLIVSGTDANSTDGNLTDVVLWVAVANGEPKPRWSRVEVILMSVAGEETLVPPRLRINDQDGDGRVSEGDLLMLSALTVEEAEGSVTLWRGGEAIGTVRL